VQGSLYRPRAALSVAPFPREVMTAARLECARIAAGQPERVGILAEHAVNSDGVNVPRRVLTLRCAHQRFRKLDLNP
jgi:hypothetical protein